MNDQDLNQMEHAYNNAMPVNLFKALSEFQSECPTIHKGTQGHNYSYADLPTIFEVINPLLKKHGLVFTQLLVGENIRTILVHSESGEYIESITTIPQVELRNMNLYQSNGAGYSYYRRYALSSMLGLVTDKDTDAGGTALKRLDTKTFEKYLNNCETKERLESFEKFLKDYTLTEAQNKALEVLKANIK